MFQGTLARTVVWMHTRSAVWNVSSCPFVKTPAPECFQRVCRVWEAAYEQLQMEKGVCNLIQKYTPEAVRERALSSPSAAFQILVSSLPAELPT